MLTNKNIAIEQALKENTSRLGIVNQLEKSYQIGEVFDTIITKNNKNRQRPKEIGNMKVFFDYKHYNCVDLGINSLNCILKNGII